MGIAYHMLSQIRRRCCSCRGSRWRRKRRGSGCSCCRGRRARSGTRRAIGGAVVDGFVIYSMSDEDPLVEAALARRIPTVLVDQPRPEGGPSVGIDDEGAARSVAGHLIDLGHRRFGVISFAIAPDPIDGLAGPDRQAAATFATSRSRLRGYRSALEDAGLSWKDVPVYELLENTPEKGRQVARALLSREPQPTALLCLSDQLALGALEAARSLGISVPEDLSVVGFDDVPEAARAVPALTTIHQPHVEKGLLAGRLLLSHLRGEEQPISELLPTQLVVARLHRTTRW